MAPTSTPTQSRFGSLAWVAIAHAWAGRGGSDGKHQVCASGVLANDSNSCQLHPLSELLKPAAGAVPAIRSLAAVFFIWRTAYSSSPLEDQCKPAASARYIPVLVPASRPSLVAIIVFTPRHASTNFGATPTNRPSTEKMPWLVPTVSFKSHSLFLSFAPSRKLDATCVRFLSDYEQLPGMRVLVRPSLIMFVTQEAVSRIE